MAHNGLTRGGGGGRTKNLSGAVYVTRDMTTEPAFTAEEAVGFSKLLRPSAIVLILANLGPVYGVLFLGWKVFPIIFLFWLENIVIGALNVFRMLLADPKNRLFWFLKIPLIPFFCVHYGLFTFVHGVFVMGLFGGMFRQGAPFPGEDVVIGFIRQYQLGWAIFGLAASHLLSFVVNYVGEGEYLRASPMQLMQQPYGRVIVLHVTIIAGGFLVTILNSPLVGLLLLVALKIGLDLRSHLREHRTTQPVLRGGDLKHSF